MGKTKIASRRTRTKKSTTRATRTRAKTTRATKSRKLQYIPQFNFQLPSFPTNIDLPSPLPEKFHKREISILLPKPAALHEVPTPDQALQKYKEDLRKKTTYTTIPTYSARTSKFRKFMKTTPIRTFFIASHGTLLPKITELNERTFAIYTGECGTSTYVDAIEKYIGLFGDMNKTLDVFFGKKGLAQNSVYEHLRVHFPLELTIVKYLNYSKDDMVNGTGIYMQEGDTITKVTTVNRHGVPHNIDSLMNAGILSTNLISYLNETYTDSINMMFFISCTGMLERMPAYKYSIVTALMPRTFYAVTPGSPGTPSRLVNRFQISPITYEKDPGEHSWSDIPGIRIVFVYDRSGETFGISNIHDLYTYYVYLMEHNFYVPSRFYVYFEHILEDEFTQNLVEIKEFFDELA